MKKTGKVFLILLSGILVLLTAAGIAFYAFTHGFYRDSNFVKDEQAMEGYVTPPASESENVPEQEAKGEILSEEEQKELEEKIEQFSSEEPVVTDSDVYNILLAGVDRRDESWAGNSDTMILLSINYKKEQISMISLMRDTYVNIPGIGMRKLNAAHANGAGPLLVQTVSENFKVQVDRYISVDFAGMMGIIDDLGGIELTLSEEEVRVANGYIREMCRLQGLDAEDYLYPEAGTYNCSGMRAVAYARIRYVGNADYERTERQRTVLTKMMEKLQLLDMQQLYRFAKETLPLVTHNVPESELWRLMLKIPSLSGYKLVKDRIPYDGMYRVIYVNGQDMLVPDWEETVQRLQETLF